MDVICATFYNIQKHQNESKIYSLRPVCNILFYAKRGINIHPSFVLTSFIMKRQFPLWNVFFTIQFSPFCIICTHYEKRQILCLGSEYNRRLNIVYILVRVCCILPGKKLHSFSLTKTFVARTTTVLRKNFFNSMSCAPVETFPVHSSQRNLSLLRKVRLYVHRVYSPSEKCGKHATRITFHRHNRSRIYVSRL